MSKSQYICQRAAHAIIAEIGPLRVSSDALGSINVFIDEFLSILINTALSLDLVELKAAVVKLLPFSLGKKALVEAEIELKHQVETEQQDFTSYEKMRNISDQQGGIFPTEKIIPLLQAACANYCTLAADDNASDILSGTNKENDIVIAPVVVIYVTAIVEHIAEYILNSVAMTADQADTEHIRVKEVLFTLIDDPQVNMLFRRMNLKEKLEKRASVYSPNFNYNMPILAPPTPSPSPISLKRNNLKTYSTNSDSIQEEERAIIPSSSYCSMRSSESINDRPLSISSNNTVKSSGSKSRFNFFSSNKEKRTSTISMSFSSSKRSSSSSSTSSSTITSPVTPSFNNLLSNDFEDLIRSGSTRKVTLTPNRLRSIEVKEDNHSDVTPWNKVPSPTSKTNNSSKKKRSTNIDTTPPPPLPPLPRVYQQQQYQQLQPQLQQSANDSNNSPPLTPASSVASRPSQRSRHSIIYEKKLNASTSRSSMKSYLANEESSTDTPLTAIERPSSMVVKRASMGSRPPSFHENVVILDTNNILMAAIAAGTASAEEGEKKTDIIYVIPRTPLMKSNSLKRTVIDKGCQTDPTALNSLILNKEVEEQEEEWFMEEEEWEDHVEEEKIVAEWLLGNV